MEFDEEGTWNWSSHLEGQSISHPIEEQEKDEHQEINEPVFPQSPTLIQEELSSEESSRQKTPRVRSLEQIYKITQPLEDITLFCLFVDCEPIGYEEAM